MASTGTRHAPRTATVKQDASSEAGVVVVVEPPGTVVVGAPGVVVVDVVGPGSVFGAVVELVEPAGMVDVVDVGTPATTDDDAGSSPPVVNTPAPAPAATAAPTATAVPAPIPPPTPDASPAAVIVPAIPAAVNQGGIDDAPDAVAPTLMLGLAPGK